MTGKQIEERTQNADEPVVIYISVMENLFYCLSEMPTENKKLQILKSRVLPQYQSHLAMKSISSIADLVECCRLLEEAEKSKKLFNVNKPGTSKEHTGNHKDSRNSSDSYKYHKRQDSRTFAGTSGTNQRSMQGQVAEIHCWNCNSVGHVQRDCKKGHNKPVCYGCGRRNVIRPNCPSCSKNARKGGDN